MEIDFSETKLNVTLLLSVVAVVLGLLLLGMLGKFVLPGQVLTWGEWQMLQQRAAYQQEVVILQRAADKLTRMVNQEDIEPIHAQLASEQVVRKFEDVSLIPLDAPRQALLETAQAIIDWSLGDSKQQAISVQIRANQLVLQASR